MRRRMKSMSNTQTEEIRRSLWDRFLELLEEDLAERRGKRVEVEVRGEFGIRRKEVAELSPAERRSLDPELREYVAEQLLDRYLAQQGRVDLLKGRCAYTKNFRELTPEDLQALIKADQYRADEYRRAQEDEQSIRRMREELDQLRVVEFAEPAA
jgi:hypothetical protein